MLRTLGLLAVAAIALWTAHSTWSSVTGYQSPYQKQRGRPGGDPVAERAVLIVLDGVRLDASSRMRELQALAQRGSSGTVQAALPSLSNPNRAVLVTGAWPEVNGVTNNGRYEPPPVDSLFSLAASTGMPLAAAGSSLWGRAFGEYLEGHLLFQTKSLSHNATPEAMAMWQEDNCRDSEQFLARYESGFLAVGVAAADAAGHDFGGESEAYHHVAQAVDRCLGSLVRALDNGRTVFAIVSDHGHIQHRAGGGHGGSEPEAIEVPLVFASKGIRNSDGWRAPAVDVAPTLAILLGLPLPGTSQGNVLWDALDLTAEQARSAKARFQAQQQALAEILPQGRPSPDWRRPERALPALAVLLLAMVAAGFTYSRSRNRLALLIAVAAYLGLYYLLFAALGLGYSLSVINREEFLPLFLGKNLLAASVAFLAVAVTLRRRAPEATSTAHLALGIISISTMQVAWLHYQSGLFMTDAMPDLNLNLKAALDLLQIAAVAVSAALVALLPRHRAAPNVSAQNAIVGDRP
ncbi:MAG: alkaline phosphatase family protein [Acidobacteria bacterium]|nr:alkaline phosphatase family protein [Acidobacteriota bacterium]